MGKQKKAKVIHISGRRWFHRGPGNTYHSVNAWVDGDLVYRCDYAYGYGAHYEQTAERGLEELGYLPGLEKYKNGGSESLYRYCERKGIKFVSEVVDVGRKKDL